MALITAEQLLQACSRLHDASLELLPVVIGQADMLEAAYCGLPRQSNGKRTMASGTYVLYPSPSVWEPRALDLRLHPVPIGSITSAYVDDNWEYGSSTLVSSDDYVLADDTGLLWLTPSSGEAWSDVPRANKITLVAGYDLSEESTHSLVAITASIVQSLLERPQLQQQASMTIAGGSLTTTDLEHLIPAAARAALDAECRIWGASCG